MAGGGAAWQVQSFAISGGIMWVLYYVIAELRDNLGKNNISSKALVNPMFLL